MFNVPSFEKPLRDESCNSGPPSSYISSGPPKIAKYVCKKRTKAAAPAMLDPDDVPSKSAQPENLSPIIKKFRSL